MSPTTVAARSPLRWLVLTLGGMLAAVALSLSMPGASFAASGDDGGDDSTDLPYTIVVNVRSGGEAVAGATVTVKGGDFEGEATTDEDGRAHIGVPDKETVWTIELVKSSLPSGVEAPDGFAFTQEATFGAGSSVTKNFTLVAAERQTTSFADQLASRVVNGLNFGLMLALAAIGLSVHFGFAGLLNMGVAGFMAIGAYGFAISILTFGLAWPVAALIGLLAAVVFAIILGIPTLRLRGDYLAIVTIAAAEVLRLLFLTSSFRQWTGSADGLSGFQASFRASNPLPPGKWGFGPWTYQSDQWWVIVVGIITIAIVVLFVWLLMSSPWGRVIRGIREDEDAVRSLGKNVFAFKMQALIVGGMIIAAGGIITAMGTNVNPNVYVTSQTFFVWTALLLGGAATIFGPVLGAVLFWMVRAFLSNLLPAMVQAGLLPFLTVEQSQMLVFVLVGIALMLIVIFRPQGILGSKKELTFVR